MKIGDLSIETPMSIGFPIVTHDDTGISDGFAGGRAKTAARCWENAGNLFKWSMGLFQYLGNFGDSNWGIYW